MKSSLYPHRLLQALAVASAAALLAACASTPLEETPAVAPVADKSGTTSPSTGTVIQPGSDSRAIARVDTTPRALDPLNDPGSPLAKRSVFFDFDSFAVKPEYQSLIEAHGKHLVANRSRNVVIEGNTDERGSREYNLALGQKRAEAVKSRMRLLGAADNQIETISLGEEKPRATGSTEEAWAQNRRADIVYK